MTEPQERPEPPLYWGTNPQGGTADRYAGSVHVVWPDNLCPLCCVRAMAALFPAFSESLLIQPLGTGKHGLSTQDHQAPPMRSSEKTILIPATRPNNLFT